MNERHISTDPYVRGLIAGIDDSNSRGPCMKEPCSHAGFYGMTCDDDVFGGVCGAFTPFPEGTSDEVISLVYGLNQEARCQRGEIYRLKDELDKVERQMGRVPRVVRLVMGWKP